MKYPKLVRVCKTPVTVKIDREGLSEDGEPLRAVEISVMCNFQDGARQVMTAEKQIVEVSGVVLIDGDIAPDLPVLAAGRAVINGATRAIYRGVKARNPDGTVNYTRLELI